MLFLFSKVDQRVHEKLTLYKHRILTWFINSKLLKKLTIILAYKLMHTVNPFPNSSIRSIVHLSAQLDVVNRAVLVAQQAAVECQDIVFSEHQILQTGPFEYILGDIGTINPDNALNKVVIVATLHIGKQSNLRRYTKWPCREVLLERAHP